MVSETIHLKCLPCARRGGKKRCPAIKYPSEVWEKGSCWAFTTDEEEVRKAEEEIKAYAERKAAEKMATGS
ncbi:hypothetical protein [Neomoorella thermoacetica]|uniref:hypothetical protein n=1 Tax=Neomoorella thermoacetica TaxID=1525 RepID=UPI0030CE7F98